MDSKGAKQPSRGDYSLSSKNHHRLKFGILFLYKAQGCVFVTWFDKKRTHKKGPGRLGNNPEALIEIILNQADTIAELSDRIDQITNQLNDKNNELSNLQIRFMQQQRSAYRQAAPFGKTEDKKKKDPKKPGRLKGHKGSFR